MQTIQINTKDNMYQMLNLETDEAKHFKFHHIGIATTDIEKTFEDFQYVLYKKGDYFTDEQMGVKGLFATNDSLPVLEILENLPQHHSLDIYLKNFTRGFHHAYIVDDFEYCKNLIVNKQAAKIISDIYDSAYFKGKCCYILMPDNFILELIEDKRV